MRNFIRRIVFLAVFGWASGASAVQIADVGYPLGGISSSTPFITSSVDIWLAIGNHPGVDTVSIFENLSFPLGSSSATFVADASSDPNFESFAAKLTDGVDELLWGMTAFGGGGSFEFALFGGHDLAGWDIESITLNVLSMDVTPNGFGINARVIFDGQLVSAIPEPETYAMLLAGLALLGFQAQRRKKTRIPAA